MTNQRPIYNTLAGLEAARAKRAAYAETFDAITELLEEKRWRSTVKALGETEFTSPLDILRVVLNPAGSWALQTFSEAADDYESIRRGASIRDLERALYAFCERCGADTEGKARYYPGNPQAHQPRLDYVCCACERELIAAASRAIRPAEPKPAVPAVTITSAAYEGLARVDKARVMAKLLYRGGVPSTDAMRMTSADWEGFHAGLKGKGILGPNSTVPSAETVAMVIVELRRYEATATRAAALRVHRGRAV